MTQDLYKILQVDPGADTEVIEAAYRRLARRYHPDLNHAAWAEAKWRELDAAYQTLRHPRQRALYDQRTKTFGAKRDGSSPEMPRCYRHTDHVATESCDGCGAGLCDSCAGRFQPPTCEPCAARWRSDKRVYLTLILGASEFPHTSLKSNPAFRNSAEAMESYLEALKSGPDAYRAVSLFDSNLNVIDQAGAIDEALQSSRDATDLIVYYVGHGGFLRGGREYFLALRTTKDREEDLTALRVSTLARIVRRRFADRRVFVILDCCFAGEAVHEFQSTNLGEVVEAGTLRQFPARGTALLCASSRDEPAISHARYTVFCECLLDVLQHGIEGAGPFLTLDVVAERLRVVVDYRYGDDVSLPEIHSPSQREGDIARQRLFPNPAYTKPYRPSAAVRAIGQSPPGKRWWQRR